MTIPGSMSATSATVGNLVVLNSISYAGFPNGTSTGDYLYWNATAGAWQAGGSSIQLGSGADASGMDARESGTAS